MRVLGVLGGVWGWDFVWIFLEEPVWRGFDFGRPNLEPLELTIDTN